MNRDQIDDVVRQLRRRAVEAQRAGDSARAADLDAAARALEAEAPGLLTDAESSPNLHRVTDAQLARRGRAIAKGKAAKSRDRLLIAISESKWRSQEDYARERLQVSPGALSGYRSGRMPCPRRVADLVRKDFGIGYDYWRRGVVD